MTSAETDGVSQLRLPLGDLAGELSPADEAPAWSPLLGLHDAAHERNLLGALAEAAARAAQHETKTAALVRLLRRVNEPAIVFTEYRDTLLHVEASVGRPAVVLHGGLTRDERRAAIQQFTDGDINLLLATDAAGEGLNLQRSCRLVINLELPWNPMRLEQRIGRVDRIGQKRRVHVVHLIAQDSAESRLLSRLQSRIARMQNDIGGANPLGDGRGETCSDEATSSRFVIAGQTSEAAGEDSSYEPPAAELIGTPSLEHDAHAEAVRVAAARMLTRDGDEQLLARLESRGPCMMRAGHARTRARLRGGSIMIWQVAAADASGRQTGSALIPIAGADANCVNEDELLRFVDRAAGPWRKRFSDNHGRFINCLLQRERAIDVTRRLRHAARSRGGFQPGLFDRRGEREHLLDVAADAEQSQRLVALERASVLSFLPPRLLLVVVA
jgi:hypothetical protein